MNKSSSIRSGRGGPLPGPIVIGTLLFALSSCARMPAPDADTAWAAGVPGASRIGDLADLTAFQWAIWSDARLLLVPQPSGVYPAESTGRGILESIPPRIAVTLLHSGEERVVPLHDLRSPHEMEPARWQLRRREDDRWRDQGRYRFVGDGFLLDRGGSLPLSELRTVRFVPRDH